MLTQTPNARLAVQTGIVFDAVSSSAYQPAVSTYSWTHTVGAGGANRILLVAVSIFATGTVTSITYGGVSLSFVRADANSVYRTEIWQLVAPATGANTVQVNLSLSLTSIAEAASYTGVDQSTPIDANAGANGTSNPASASVTTVATKDRVFAALSTKTASGTSVASGQSDRAENTGALGTSGVSDKGLIDTPASTTLTWNGIVTLDSWAVSLAALKPVVVLSQITGTTSLTFTGSATPAGSGALVGSSTLAFTPSGTPKGTANAVGSSTLAFAPNGTVLGAGAFAASSSLTFSPSGTLRGAGAIAAASTWTFSCNGTVGGSGSLVSTAGLSFSPSGTATGSGALVSSAALTFTIIGTMAGAGALSGSSAFVFTGAGTEEGAGAMSGAATLTFSASGTVRGAGALAGAATWTWTANGTGMITTTAAEHGGFRPPKRVRPQRRDIVPTHRNGFIVFDGESSFTARLTAHLNISASFTRTNQLTGRVRGRGRLRIAETVPRGTKLTVKAGGRGSMRMRGRLSAQTVLAGHSTDRLKAGTVENPPADVVMLFR